MTTYHYGNDWPPLLRNATAREIVEQADGVHFDFTLSVFIQWGQTFEKRFTSILTTKQGSPVLIITDGADQQEHIVLIDDTMPEGSIFQKGVDAMTRKYDIKHIALLKEMGYHLRDD